MGELDTMHEEFLETSIEDEEFFGKPMQFRTRGGSISHDVTGSINRIQPKMEGGVQGKPLGRRVGVEVRHTTLQEKAGYPVDVDWRDNMPAVDWLVVLVSPWTNEVETFTIERGSIAEDGSLGLDSFWLTSYTE